MTGKGVTTDSNAAVPLWQAIGPEEIEPKEREKFFKLLGIEPPSQDGDHFVSLGDFARHHNIRDEPRRPRRKPTPLDNIYSQDARASERPWSKQEFPLVAAWLEENEKPLDRLVQAANRPQFFSPVMHDKHGGVDPTVFKLVLASHERFGALTRRAMLKLKRGDVDSAFQDVIACHRLAHLMYHDPFMIDVTIAMIADSCASEADCIIAENGAITAEQAKTFRRELKELPLLRMAKPTGLGERLVELEVVCDHVGDMPTLIQMLTTPLAGHKWQTRADKLVNSAANREIDWNAVLRRLNSWNDDVAEALGQPNYVKRKAAWTEILSRLKPSTESKANERDGHDQPSEADLSKEAADFIAGTFLLESSSPLDGEAQAETLLTLAESRPTHVRGLSNGPRRAISSHAGGFEAEVHFRRAAGSIHRRRHVAIQAGRQGLSALQRGAKRQG